MKKLLAIALALVLCLSVFAGCASNTASETKATEANTGATVADNTEASADAGTEATADVSDMKVGFIFLHDENSTYDLNFMNAAKEACANLGFSEDQYIFRTNIPEGQIGRASCRERV